MEAAAGLIGCRLLAGDRTFLIVETEAYHQDEPACHGYGGHTARAAKLRRPAGTAYVYLSYGMHHLVNVVTGTQEVASAVLFRGAVELASAGLSPVPGPGRLGRALGVTLADDGVDLLSAGPLRLAPATSDGPHGLAVAAQPLAVGPRVGITKAVDLPWRFAWSGSPGVSAPRL